MTAPAPVFHDPGGRRWPLLRRLLYGLSMVATLVLAVAVAGIVSNPFLPRLHLPMVSGLPRHTEVRPPPPPPRNPLPTPTNVQLSVAELHKAEKRHHVRPAKRPQQLTVAPPPALPPLPAPKAPRAPGERPIAAGFYVNWDDSSYASLKRNLHQLDWVIPEWARLQPAADKKVAAPLLVSIDPRALDLVRREGSGVHVLPLIQNYHDGRWDGALVAETLGDPARRAKLEDALCTLLSDSSFSGAVIDFEEVPPAGQGALLSFLGELRARFATRGWVLGEAVPFDDEDWNYESHARNTDYLFLMAYDEHWSSSAAGPVASQGWYEEKLKARLATLDPARVMVCLGGYGYDYDADDKEAEVVSFEQAMRTAHDAGTGVTFDPKSQNPVVRYSDDSGSQHEVWFLDAVTAHNEMRPADAARVAGFALWRLGGEDPSLWSVFGKVDERSPHGTDGLSQIQFPYEVEFEGTGELLQVVSTPQPGTRVVRAIGTGGTGDDVRLTETYSALPTAYTIRRTGDQPGLVALTFDDGPDPKYTPAILDILKRENVTASFFIIGERGAEHPALVRRVVAEGHDLGNHTYTHPNLGEASDVVTDLELNATQRLIESLTGRGTVLFRAPFFGDAEPQTPDEVEPIVRAEKLGYLTVGLRIDPDDWALPGTDQIVRRTLDGALSDDEEKRGHIVLLHDGGGDRSQTVSALPRLIAGLRKKGLKIVPVSQLAGLSRDQAMPKVVTRERVYRYSDSVLFYGISLASWFLRWLFLIGLVLGLCRIAIITVLAVIQRIKSRTEVANAQGIGGSHKAHRVSILVPAFNEEKVIVRSIESLLASTYPDFEILVIDDGSTDNTYQLVCGRFGGEPRVRVFTKQNGGKADTLAFGLSQATGDILVALDADTLFPPEVLAELVRPFADPRVGAVAGNAKVGNRINLVTRWQALEYVASQNLDRRAFALLDCITVVPGAVGAWRRDVIEALGGFHSDTLAEDQDLTIKVRRGGHRIAYAENAIAWTEAPDTLRALAKQRFRWSFGTLQCMWKHKRALLKNGTLGWIAMPNVWLFQLIFPLFAPLVDLLLVGAIAWAVMERIEHPAAESLRQLEPVLFYYAFFLVVDWLSAAVAFLLERGEEKSLLGWFILQRVCYRQVMYYVMIKSVYAALRGGLVGWGKLERKATVQG